MSHQFLKPNDSFEGDIDVEVDLSDYVTKVDFKNATGINNFKLALKSNLVCLKGKANKTDLHKLNPVPVYSYIDYVVKNDAVQKTVYK